jgi:hypothetical protein
VGIEPVFLYLGRRILDADASEIAGVERLTVIHLHLDAAKVLRMAPAANPVVEIDPVGELCCRGDSSL